MLLLYFLPRSLLSILSCSFRYGVVIKPNIPFLAFEAGGLY